MDNTKISLQNIGKRFRKEWIFRQVNTEWNAPQTCALLGGNGSGKSTLLQIIAGSLTPSEGNISWQNTQTNANIDPNYVFQHIAWAAPYIELIEELNLQEAITFQAQFKPFRHTANLNELIQLAQLQQAKDKQLRFFSSGMKQRAKLLLAIMADTPILLLDEPTTNLDTKGIDWYRTLMEQHIENRLVIVASNQKHEYDFCQQHLHIEQYKP
jgi:ABC-type multidrug transport system ATPase subunit